ncbi:MAG: LysR family transcriptional regulator [Lachnospirales bacterium]
MYFDISLDLYKVFCTVVRTGNMSLTAKQLYISQPAVSMSIKQLEEKLGKPLLIRSAKGILPTTEGKVLYKYLSEAMDLIELAESKYMEITNLHLGDLTIGASDVLLSNFLMPHIEQFIKLHPKINIKVENLSSAQTINLLKEGKIDVGFVNLPIEKSDGIDITEIMPIQDCLIGGTKYKDLAQKGVTIKELNDYSLLMLAKGCNARRNIDEMAKAEGVRLVPNIELSSSESIIKVAKLNLGLAVVVKDFSMDVIDNVELFEIPLKPSLEGRAIGIATLKGVDPSNATKNFIGLLEL